MMAEGNVAAVREYRSRDSWFASWLEAVKGWRRMRIELLPPEQRRNGQKCEFVLQTPEGTEPTADLVMGVMQEYNASDVAKTILAHRMNQQMMRTAIQTEVYSGSAAPAYSRR
jgi:hypothetical protein